MLIFFIVSPLVRVGLRKIDTNTFFQKKLAEYLVVWKILYTFANVINKQLRVMTKKDLIQLLRRTACRYAEVVVDVLDRNGSLVYPDEKIIISVLETQLREDFYGKAYCVFNSIKDFRESAIFGVDEAYKYMSGYCFWNIKSVKFIF